jgi:Protein of unknown function (DUF3562)
MQSTEHANVIKALSDELHIPVQQVGTVFSQELHRLAAQARVQAFLVLLATRNARSVLRDGRGEAH